MGVDTALPHQLENGEGNTPDATEIMANLNFINQTQRNQVINGDFERWDAGTDVAPSSWTAAGTGAVIAQDADEKHGDWAAKITYGSADASLYQDASEFAFYQGRKVKAWAWVKCSTVGIAKLTISDGVGSTDSSFHTGGGTYELLTVEHTMASAATRFRLECHVVNTGNALFDAAVMIDYESVLGVLDNIYDAYNEWKPALGTWAYASASTITVPAGAASLYQVGDKIKLTQTTVKYFKVTVVADTLLTVSGGAAYTVANAAITSPYYSKAENPQGWLESNFASYIQAHTGNGHGSSRTTIRRFTTVDTVGTAITHVDSATNGGEFTINEAGYYAIYYEDASGATACTVGLSVNASNFGGINAISLAEGRVGVCSTAGANYYNGLCVVLRLAIGDIIRCHTDGAPNYASTLCHLKITRILQR